MQRFKRDSLLTTDIWISKFMKRRSFVLWIIVRVAAVATVHVHSLARHETSMRRRFLAGVVAGGSSIAFSTSTATAAPLFSLASTPLPTILFQQQQPDAFSLKRSQSFPPRKPSKQRQMQELQDVRLDQCDKTDLQRFDQCFFYGNGSSSNNGRFLSPKTTIPNGPPTW